MGSILVSGRPSLQFLGDTGNVAARLEAATKELGCVLAASEATVALAGASALLDGARAEVRIAGREALGAEQHCSVVALRDRSQARLPDAGERRRVTEPSLALGASPA